MIKTGIKTGLIAALMIVGSPTLVVASDLTGPACVINADTLSINGVRKGRYCQGGTKVRLHGIDGLELDQTCKHSSGRDFLCGRYSASFLLEHIKGKAVTCQGTTKDGDGNIMATCYVGSKNLNELMVREGWAMVDRSQSLKYEAAETHSRNMKKGIWAMDFVPPWQWRKQKGRD